MPYDIVVALTLCLLSGVALFLALMVGLKQKIFLDEKGSAITTEIEIPFFGKIKTGAPVLALAFFGAAFGWLGYDITKNRGPHLVEFDGKIEIDRQSITDLSAVMIGVTGPWGRVRTPNGAETTINLKVLAPSSMTSYTAYAFPLNSTDAKPVVVGTSIENPKFVLRLER